MLNIGRKGARYAVFGYGLICLVVVAGMSWATSSTWQLARLTQSENYRALLRESVGRLDNHLLGIFKTEAARDFRDYAAFYMPVEIRSTDLSELEPREFLLPSPIAVSRPRYDWIDLYFQVNQNGEWSSPHLPKEGRAALIEAEGWDDAASWRARRILSWLQEELTTGQLQGALASALSRDASGSIVESEGSEQVVHVAPWSQEDLRGGAELPWEPTSGNRKDRRDAPQWRYVPKPSCVPTDMWENYLRGVDLMVAKDPDDASLASTPIEVRQSPLTPIWIPSQGMGMKVAFVRSVNSLEQVLYQGFVADWYRLKADLLRRVSDVAPGADLIPIRDSLEEVESSMERMQQLPARLVVPSEEIATAASTWDSVRGVLLPSWGAALAVLIAAGFGIRNLVSLTHRRLQFAYAVTHELRTPLTTFRLYTDLLSAGLVPEESRQEYLDTLNREAQRLATLVEDVLDYARLENQKIRLNPVTVSGDSLLGSLTESIESRCKINGIETVTRNDVPKAQEIVTDVDLVTQIVGVLVNNACRHSQASARPTVLVYLDVADGRVQLHVVDSGKGVDRSDARLIFRPFRRGRNADAAAQGGIGLGLSLARTWASLLGGRLDLVARHHTKMGGAHFRLSIPSVMNETPD